MEDEPDRGTDASHAPVTLPWSVSNELTEDERETIYRWLSEESYWAKGLPRSVFERSLLGSLCFVLRDGSAAVRGFARVVTDRATFAYLADVFVESGARGGGVGKALMKSILAHPDLQGLRRWLLATRDAHGLYRQFDFEPLRSPEIYMQRHDPDVYARLNRFSDE